MCREIDPQGKESSSYLVLAQDESFNCYFKMDFQLFASVMVIEAKDYSGHGTVMCQSMMEVPHHPCDPSCDGEIMCAPVYDNQMYLFHADDGTNQVRSNM